MDYICQSVDDILDYLRNLPTDICELNQSSIDRINAAHERLMNSQVEVDLSPLIKYRILASNTLRHGTEVSNWEKATHFVTLSVMQEQPFSLEALAEINGILTGQKSEIRKNKLFACGEEYLPPEFVDSTLKEFFALIPTIQHPLLKGFLAYCWVVTIHAFDNGNGRTARLAGDWFLLDNGYLPVCFPTPVFSHVAQKLGIPRMSIVESFEKYLVGVEKAYQVIGMT